MHTLGSNYHLATGEDAFTEYSFQDFKNQFGRADSILEISDQAALAEVIGPETSFGGDDPRYRHRWRRHR